MANSCTSLSSQALPSFVLDDLKKGLCNNEVFVRVIHFWEARNVRKGGLLLGFELLLMDQKASVIHAFIPANRISIYEADLKAGAVYRIGKFLVLDNKKSYRVTSHKFLIQFTVKTTLVEAEYSDLSIERQNFRFRSYEEFKEAVDMNIDLYDAIGKVVLIKTENFKDPELDDYSDSVSKSRIEVHLQLREGPIVRLTLWGKVGANFHKKWMKSVNKPVVLLATTVNPKTYSDMFSLSSTSSTRIFFDRDVEPSSEYLTWLADSGNNAIITSEVTKLETVTITEIFQFLKDQTPQMISFSCTATIVDILPQYGWYYIACTKCKCKLGRSDTTLVCQRCNHENTVGLIKFRVELTVCDEDNVATFVIFGDDVAKIAGRKAEDILEEDVQGDDNGAMKNHTTPECLLDIVGRTYKFNIQLKAFDFTSTRQTITVTSIIKEIVDDEDSVQEEAAALEGTHGDALCEDGSKTLEADDDVAINQKKKKARHE